MTSRGIDDTSGVARYVQVARLLEREIRAGKWLPGRAIPSQIHLSQQYGIAKTTAAKSHAYLAERGLVIRAPGVGMVVLPRARWAPAEE
jgi:GntR family transcriptional regulator